MKKSGWQVRTRQKEGERTERRVVKGRGGKVHPRSGAGRIKWDGSSETELIEVKDAQKTHTLNGAYLRSLYAEAARQGKDAIYCIKFKDAGVTATIHITKE